MRIKTLLFLITAVAIFLHNDARAGICDLFKSKTTAVESKTIDIENISSSEIFRGSGLWKRKSEAAKKANALEKEVQNLKKEAETLVEERRHYGTIESLVQDAEAAGSAHNARLLREGPDVITSATYEKYNTAIRILDRAQDIDSRLSEIASLEPKKYEELNQARKEAVEASGSAQFSEVEIITPYNTGERPFLQIRDNAGNTFRWTSKDTNPVLYKTNKPKD